MKHIKVSDHVYEKLKQLAEKRFVSLNNVVEEILNIYLGGSQDDRPIKQIINKFIQLHYPAVCNVCKKQLAVNTLVFYVKYVYDDNSSRTNIICLDCYYSSSTALAKYYLRERELKAVIKGLREEADKLAKAVLELRRSINIFELLNKVDKKLLSTNDNELKELLIMLKQYVRELVVNTYAKTEKALNVIKRYK